MQTGVTLLAFFFLFLGSGSTAYEVFLFLLFLSVSSIAKVRNWVLLVSLLIPIDFICFYFACGGVIQYLGPRCPLFLD